jgi:hypothetical protein
MKNLAWMVILGLVISACSSAPIPTAPVDEVSTVVAGAMQALSPTVPPVETVPTLVSSTQVSLEGISFVLQAGIAGGALAEPQEAMPPSENMPWWEIHPAYVEYPLQGYLLSNTFHEPKIYVYPVDEFIQMNADVGGGIENLKSILSSPDDPLPDHLPFLPTFNAAQVFYSNTQLVKFQNGSGIRYLTQFGQAPAPINNHEVFYTFQGITNDNKYYVSAVLPINTPFLAEYASPEYPVPADGIPFDWDNHENVTTHVEAVRQKLNSTNPNLFTPPLLSLDALFQSISITGNP